MACYWDGRRNRRVVSAITLPDSSPERLRRALDVAAEVIAANREHSAAVSSAAGGTPWRGAPHEALAPWEWDVREVRLRSDAELANTRQGLDEQLFDTLVQRLVGGTRVALRPGNRGVDVRDALAVYDHSWRRHPSYFTATVNGPEAVLGMLTWAYRLRHIAKHFALWEGRDEVAGRGLPTSPVDEGVAEHLADHVAAQTLLHAPGARERVLGYVANHIRDDVAPQLSNQAVALALRKRSGPALAKVHRRMSKPTERMLDQKAAKRVELEGEEAVTRYEASK